MRDSLIALKLVLATKPVAGSRVIVIAPTEVSRSSLSYPNTIVCPPDTLSLESRKLESYVSCTLPEIGPLQVMSLSKDPS